MMKEIRTDSATRLSNAAHIEKNTQILQIITENIAESLGLSEQRKKYNDLLLKEDEVFKVNRSYEETPELIIVDKSRDNGFMFVMNTIRVNIMNIDEVKKKAATKLEHVIKIYRGSQKKSYFEQSALLTNFVNCLQQPENAANINILGLTAAVEKVKTENQKFIELYTARFNETEQRKAHEQMKQIRRKVDAAYHVLRDTINALYLYQVQIQKESEVEKVLAAIIDAINAVLEMAKQWMNHKGKKKDDPDGDTTT